MSMKTKMGIFRKTCASVLVFLILPALAIAKSGGEKDINGDKNGKGDINANPKGNGDDKNKNKGGHKPPVVPEANAAWVLVPFFGAVLLYSWRKLVPAKA